VLAEYLDEVVWQHLAQLRGLRGTLSRDQLTPEREILLAQKDFRTGSNRLESWSVLYWQYYASNVTPLAALPGKLGTSRRTLSRRTSQGYQLLAAALREHEKEFALEQRRSEGSAVYEQIAFERRVQGRSTREAMRALRSGVGSESAVVRLSPTEVDGIIRYPVADLVEYRLGGIAEWSQPRYRLDERFVELSLLVDCGDESPTGRWGVAEKRYSLLRDALADLPDPALVLLGAPGSGKSTLLRHLELAAAIDGLRQSSGPVTFLVSLNRFGPEGADSPISDPREWLSKRWSARYPNLRPLEELLADGEVLLLLDGLNEMPHHGRSDYRDRIVRWKQFLLDLTAASTGNRLVFACRSLDYSVPRLFPGGIL